MDQDNLCIRAIDCNNSNVVEQTLGNDNSVTGFSDQSSNVQAAVTVTPTPIVTPTPTPTLSHICSPDTEDENLRSKEPNESATPPPGSLCPQGFDKPITALRTAVDNDGTLDKEATSYNDIFDAFRLALKFYRYEERTD